MRPPALKPAAGAQHPAPARGADTAARPALRGSLEASQSGGKTGLMLLGRRAMISRMLSALGVGASVHAQQSASVAPSLQPPPDDGLRARLIELASAQNANTSAPEVERINALI